MGFALMPVVVMFSSCLALIVVYFFSLFSAIKMSGLGAFGFGVWCALPAALLIHRDLWLPMVVTAPLLPFLLGVVYGRHGQ
ncbi:MAG: hypothetical protein NVV68_01385 [Dokdonella sp.]|nr:hypothetical protein [Dokdonella sp.]